MVGRRAGEAQCRQSAKQRGLVLPLMQRVRRGSCDRGRSECAEKERAGGNGGGRLKNAPSMTHVSYVRCAVDHGLQPVAAIVWLPVCAERATGSRGK